MKKHPQCALFGGLLLDRYCELDRFPERGGDAVILDEYDRVGGCAANMAVSFQNLGGRAHIVGSLGAGPIGRRIGRYLDEHGLSRRLITPVEADSGCCYVFLEPDGERTFLTRDSLGAYPAALVKENLNDMDCAALTGYYLMEHPQALAEDLGPWAERGGLLLYDPGPLLQRIDDRAQKRILSAAAIVSMNEAEARQLPLPEKASRILILKRGAEGGRVCGPAGVFDYPAVPARTVDGTGAGDAFDGALLFGLCAGLSLEKAVDLAARAAAKTVEIRGPHGFWEMQP